VSTSKDCADDHDGKPAEAKRMMRGMVFFTKYPMHWSGNYASNPEAIPDAESKHSTSRINTRQ
jgi:hypothetical protein